MIIKKSLKFIQVFSLALLWSCGESVTDVDFRNQNNGLSTPPPPSLEIDKISVSNLEISEITNSSFEVSLDAVGDQNGNAVVTIYYCNETLNPGCDPLTAGNSQQLDSGSNLFTSEISPLMAPAYNKGDVINVTVITTDSDGVNLGSTYSTQFTLMLIKRIYRSVGYGNTTALASGTGNGFTISDGVATFTNPLPGNVGVGDVIQFDSSDNSTIDALVFITERLNNIEYEVRTNLGVRPADMITADEDWEIYRAYTRLDYAEDGTENIGLDDILENFDTWSTGRDLVTNEEQWNIALYADAPNASGTYLDGWTTDENYHLKVFAPSTQSEVGVSQRHSGVWDDSKATLTVAGNGETLYINTLFTIVEGLQIESNTNLSNSSRVGIQIDFDLAGGSKVIGNIIRNGNQNSTVKSGIRFGSASTGAGRNFYIINNIIYGHDSDCIAQSAGIVGTIYAYNNTLVNCGTGISGNNNNLIAKNNIVQGATTAYGGGVDATNSDFNISNTLTGSGGVNDQTSASVLFLDAANNDFRLSSFDTIAVGAGIDLSSDADYSFLDDSNKNPRGVSWDIGATQAFLSNQLDARISNLQISTTGTSFNSVVTLEGDNNNNSTAILYFCNETDTPSCDPETGTATPMTKVAGDYALNISGLISPNDPGDILNIRVVLTDTDGAYGSPIDTQITLENTIKKIYRSVGPGNITALASGTGNDLQIFNGTANFSLDIADNIGVGDVIQYDSNDDGTIDSIVFIHGRINGQSFSVRNTDGSVPTNLLDADNDWEIYRAYTSLENATDGVENSALDDAIEDFDTWVSSRDLVANNEQWNITCYADALDTAEASISGWTTSLDNKLHIYTPYLPSEVGISQRHNGRWRKPIEAYTMAIAGASATSAIVINSPNVHIEGLQINPLGSATHANNGIRATNLQNYVEISHNIIKADFSVEARIGEPTGIALTMGSSGEARIWNNIVIGFKNRELTGIGIRTGYEEVFMYNNTVSMTDRCFYNDNNTDTHYKNNISADCNIGFDLQTAAGAGSSNNISRDGTAPGTGSQTFQIIQFNMPEIYDFRLAGNSYTAKGTGVDLSLDPDLPITDDITSLPRESTWDMGASIAPTAIFRSVGEGNTATLQNGAGNDLDIVVNAEGHTQANFASSISDNIGVGDVIQYDPDNAGGVDSIAFISERIDSQSFIVKNVNGDNCTTTTSASQSWDIFRAYSSFVDANDGVENPGIADALEDFDTWSDGKDLKYPREQWNIALYADGPGTGYTQFQNWGTTPLYRLKLFAPYDATEVGTSQRHQGIYDNTKALKLGRTSFGASLIIDGMQLANLDDPTIGNNPALEIGDSDPEERVYIVKNSILRASDLPGGGNLDAVLRIGSNTSLGNANYYIYNNLFLDGPYAAYVSNTFVSDLYFYHNTIMNPNIDGIHFGGPADGFIAMKNNISYAKEDDYRFGFTDVTSHNISFDGTSLDGVEFQNQNVGFLNSAREDFRLSGTDISAINRAIDLKNDPYLSVTTDMLGTLRTQPDIGAFEAARHIYRSMGFGNTTALATGAGNDLTLINGIATFASNLSDNIGVGDAIQYDSDGDTTIDALVFISGRIAADEFIVQTTSGDVPSDMSTGDQDWSIFRAYTSLANAEDGVENTGIDDTLEDFDTWSGGRNLVAAGLNWNIALYADTVDTGNIVIDGWTTSSGNRLNFFVPYLAKHVGISQRHNGTAGTGFVLNSAIGNTHSLEIVTDYTTIDGLEITKVAGTNSEEGIRTTRTGVVIKNNIIHDIQGGANNDAIHIEEDGITNAEIFIYNNLIYDISRKAVLLQDSSGINGFRIYLYNNTMINIKTTNTEARYGAVGFDSNHVFSDCIIYAKNNYIHTLDNEAFHEDDSPGGIFDPSSTNNASNDTSAPGSNPVFNLEFPLFEDINNQLYRLAALDSTINGQGLNLSDDEYLNITHDIVGNPKNFDGEPDIGAFEAPTKIFRSSGYNNIAALAVGAGNGLTINNGIATFVNSLPSNIGVGDVIQLDTNNNGVIDRIAVIHGRIDSQNYKVRNTDGSVPNNSLLSDEDWSIFRAASGLAQAESGDENDSINDGLEDFDTWTGGKDMVSAHEQWNIAIYGDAIDESNANAEGWVTSRIHRLKIFAPHLSSEVGYSQRHYGVWSPDAATLEENGGDVMAITDEHVTIDGLQFMSDSITTNDNSLDINLQGLGSTDIEISNNIMRYPLGDSGTHSILIRADNLNQEVKIFNNIIYYESPGPISSHCINSESSNTFTGYIYHNTCYGPSSAGIRNASATADVIIKNNITQNTGGISYNGTFNAASTNNLTDDSSAQGLNQIVSTTVEFNDLTNFDFRLSPYDTTAHDVGADLSGDINLNVQTDIIGMTRGSAGGVDVGAHEGATPIFRSIEYQNTAALDTGASGNLDIALGVATFANDVPDNVGVGDAIQYDVNNDGTIDGSDAIVFIHRRNSATSFNVRLSDGTLPPDTVASDTDWSIFRAYTSAAEAMTGVGGTLGEENTSIDADLRNFDTHTTPVDMVDTNTQWNFALYASSSIESNSTYTMNGWTTYEMNYMKLFAPHLFSEVGDSQRHRGEWDENYAMLRVNNNGTCANGGHIKVDGIQFDYQNTGTCLTLSGTGSIISNNIIANTLGGNLGTGILFVNSSYYNSKVFNNIISDVANRGIRWNMSDSTNRRKLIVYNNTVNMAAGAIGNAFGGSFNGVICKNNLAQGDGTTDLFEANRCDGVGSDYNLSSDATANGANSVLNATVAFVDAANRNFFIANTDVAAKDAGTDLSADPELPLSSDATGMPRGVWEIGALRDDPLVGFTAYNAEGSGTPADPYNIYNKAQLLDIGNNGCNSVDTVACGDSFKLVDSINLSGETYTPIGDCTNTYTGTFDGDGKTVQALTINLPAVDCVGLIGATDGAVIKDIILENTDVIGDEFVGGLVGQVGGSSEIFDIELDGLIDGNTGAVGGIIGQAFSTAHIYSSISNIQIGSRTPVQASGGLVGHLTGFVIVENSQSQGTVIGSQFSGGLVGQMTNSASIDSSYSTADISSPVGYGIGGLVGATDNSVTINNSFATGNVSGSQNNVGGLIGSHYATGTVTNSYALGNVSGDSDVGGFVGNVISAADFSNSYALGDVIGLVNNVGGFVGRIQDSSTTLSKLWAGGDVHGQGDSTGGFVGTNSGATIPDSFAIGNVRGDGVNVGGFVGNDSAGTYIRSYAKGNVFSADVTTSSYIGGFAGYASGSTLTNVYATGNVSSLGGTIGGLVGSLVTSSSINSSFATGDVHGIGQSAGGLVGFCGDSIVDSSYAKGNVYSGDQYAGGLIGVVTGTSSVTNNFTKGDVFGNARVGGLIGSTSGGTISNNYSFGFPSGNSFVAALVGNDGGSNTYAYNYWNFDITGIMAGVTGTLEIANQFEPLEVTRFQLNSTFNSNWNYTTIWTQANKYGLPHHKWTPEGQCTDNPTVNGHDDIGSGTASDPFVICNKPQFEDMRNMADPSSEFVLGADIDLMESTVPNIALPNSFSGVIDGRGHKVYNLAQPLLGWSSEETFYFKNIHLVNISTVELFPDPLNIKLLNLKVHGVLGTSDSNTGLLSQSFGNDTGRAVAHSVEGHGLLTAGSGGFVGGLFAFASWNSHLVKVSSYINVTSGGTTGSIAGTGATKLKKSYSTGVVTGAGGSTGGMIGNGVSGYIDSSFSSAIVSQSAGNYTGGLTGNMNYGRIQNSYFAGEVSGGSSLETGGISGADVDADLFNSYSAATSLVGMNNVGGIGMNDYLSTGMGNFWDTDLSGEADCDEDGTGNIAGECEGRTSIQMATDSTYTTASWDTTNTWLLRTAIAPPVLRWATHPLCQANATATLYNDIGSGTVDDPYGLCFPEQLKDLADNGCNSGTSTAGCDDYYVLLNDIDLINTSMVAIGNGTNFSGVFDGKGNKLINLSIDGGSSTHQGLFTELNGARVYNFDLLRVDISSTGDYIGALAGEATSSYVKNIKVTGNVYGAGLVGGVFGFASGVEGYYTFLSDIQFYGGVSGSSTRTGGVVGSASSDVYINKAFGVGSVISSGANVGGLVGGGFTFQLMNSASNTYTSGNGQVGGVTGSNDSILTQNYSIGRVTGSSSEIGGIAGNLRGFAENNFSLSTVDSAFANSGGAIGRIRSGAFAGYNFFGGTFASGVDNGIWGLNESFAKNNYYDSDVSGTTTQNIVEEAEPLTTSNMYLSGSFNNWDFTNTWKEISGQYLTHRSGFLQDHAIHILPNYLTEGEAYFDTTGLIALYDFDEPVIDEVGNNIIEDTTSTNFSNGTVVTGEGAADKSSQGNIWGAMDFDGVDDYVGLGNPAELQLTGAMTVTAWIYVDTASNFYIVTKHGDATDRGWDLSGNPSGGDFNLVFRIGTSSTTYITTGLSSDFPVGAWYHIVGVYRPSESIEIWVNGVLEASETTGVPANQHNSTRDVEIGAKTLDSEYFDGKIDEVSIWSRALSPEEIIRLYSRQH